MRGRRGSPWSDCSRPAPVPRSASGALGLRSRIPLEGGDADTILTTPKPVKSKQPPCQQRPRDFAGWVCRNDPVEKIPGYFLHSGDDDVTDEGGIAAVLLEDDGLLEALLLRRVLEEDDDELH